MTATTDFEFMIPGAIFYSKLSSDEVNKEMLYVFKSYDPRNGLVHCTVQFVIDALSGYIGYGRGLQIVDPESLVPVGTNCQKEAQKMIIAEAKKRMSGV